MTDANPTIHLIHQLAERIYATRTDRALHAAGQWPQHVRDALPSLGAPIPPRAPASPAQLDQYDRMIAALERQLTEVRNTHQTPPQEPTP